MTKKLILSSLGLILVAVSSTALADRVFQTFEVLSGPDMTPPFEPNGAAWLRRTPDRVDGRIMVKVDKANTAYSVWWVVFNNPEECEGFMNTPKTPCMLPDLFNPAVEAAVFNASGAISAADGELKTNGKPAGGGVINVDLEIIAGEGSDNGHAPFPLPELNGVLNPGNGCGAEIHMDVNEHANFDTDWVNELTQPEGLTHRFAIFPAVEC
jgi:hypothetical protein